MRDTFKRMIAFIIDFNLCMLPVLIILLTLIFTKSLERLPVYGVILLILLFLSPLVLMVLRDVIFKGRSLGKRIFKLYIYDKRSLGASSRKQRLQRNLLIFIYPIDGIALLATGESLGDRVAGTLVLSEAALERCRAERANPEAMAQAAKASNKRAALVIAAVVVLFIVASVIFAYFIFNVIRDTDEYKCAHEYLISSSSFQALDADESDIHIVAASTNLHRSEAGEILSETFTIGFKVKGKTFVVTCHREDGVWKACDECTFFD